MAKYINLDELLEDIERNVVFTLRPDKPSSINAELRGAKKIIDRIQCAPAADVVEVRHGRWIDMGDFISCSVCNSTRLKEFLCDYAVAKRLDVRTNYCPHCGARMDGGVNDEQ